MKIFLVLGALIIGNLASAQLTCEAKCQYFDSFNDTCLYETSCQLQGRCVVRTYCDRWDNFNDSCLDEATETNCHTPNPHAPPPSCTAKCQHFDSFEGVCKYKMKCVYTNNQRCVTHTSCERWDSFDERCLSEIHRLTCN